MFEVDIKIVLGIIIVAAPALLVVLLGVSTLLNWRFTETTINRCVGVTVVSGLLASVAVLVVMLIDGTSHVVVAAGDWIEIPHYHFSIKFVFDGLSAPMAILSFVLTGTIGAFASRYMHREPGYNRFFVLYALFSLGLTVTSVANTIETLFAGWELVGLSSALLVAYYQERPAPARNGLWIWIVYRVSDAALLLAAVALHHLAGEGDFDQLLGDGPWPQGFTMLSSGQSFVVGMLFLVAAAGKSGLIPFSGWLPRAMEGPTPSSAVFYGALSVHLGAYLLLRVSPILEGSTWLCAAIVVLGLATALLAYVVGSVQTDIKSALSYACLSQVGLIVAEIGLGLRYIALIHLIGNACLRTLQFVRAPNLLQDQRTLENAIGGHLPQPAGPVDHVPADGLRAWLYRFAIERAYLDTILTDYLAAPFLQFFRWCDSKEHQWTSFLAAQESREPESVTPQLGQIEELS